jgi:hypothetical protein
MAEMNLVMTKKNSGSSYHKIESEGDLKQVEQMHSHKEIMLLLYTKHLLVYNLLKHEVTKSFKLSTQQEDSAIAIAQDLDGIYVLLTSGNLLTFKYELGSFEEATKT